jgi:hypothetical protein
MTQAFQKIITAHFVKSASFRPVFATGVMANISPTGMLSLTPYVDRNPIPQTLPIAIDANTGRGTDDFSKAEGRTGIIRDFEVTILMDINVARGMHKILGDMIDKHEKLRPTK